MFNTEFQGDIAYCRPRIAETVMAMSRLQLMDSISEFRLWKTIGYTVFCTSLFFPAGLFAAEIDVESLEQQVRNTEIAFAQTMADRDFVAFKKFVAKDAVFLSGKSPSRGRGQVENLWKVYYQEEKAPFSWRPETVVVLASGNLALSTGPVFDRSGNLTQYFTSTWRQEEPGVWRIIFDKGDKVCEPDQ